MLKRDWNALLVDDDRDDFVLIQDALRETGSKLDWISDYDEALEELPKNRHHVYLIDYRLGARDGLQLIRAARDLGCRTPMILLTGQGDLLVDVRAMEAGASDYLEKDKIDTALLERTIRYALEQMRTQAALARRAQELSQEFARVISTDLREPLVAVTEVLAALDSRCRGRIDGEVDSTLTRGVEAAARLADLVEELEAMSRAAAEEGDST